MKKQSLAERAALIERELILMEEELAEMIISKSNKRSKRNEKSLLVKEFAKIAGVGKQYVHKWISGGQGIGFEQIIKMSKRFD